MTHYLVKWEIDIEANSPNDAAEQARKIQLDKDSKATIFTVLNVENNIKFDVDLDPEWAGEN